jgi:hypothetical protein
VGRIEAEVERLAVAQREVIEERPVESEAWPIPAWRVSGSRGYYTRIHIAGGLAMRFVELHADCPCCHGQCEVPDRDFRPGRDLGQQIVLTPKVACPLCRRRGVVETREGRDILGMVRAVGLDGLLPET